MSRYWRLTVICVLAGLLSAAALFGYDKRVSGVIVSTPVVQQIYRQDTANSLNDPASTTPITISAVGDCTIGYDYHSPLSGRFDTTLKTMKNDYGYCFSKVLPILAGDDLTIVNLETTLTRCRKPLDKGNERAYWFKGDPAYTEILRKGSVEAAFFANNHGYDYGYAGFKDTLNYLDQAGITSFGYQRKPVITIKGVRVALLGYNLVDAIEKGVKVSGVEAGMAKDIKTAREVNGANLVIVNCHWGIEGKSKADQWQIAVAHSAIDAGADLVLGHHPHVVQEVESYHGKMIAYSLGNFCFGGSRNPRDKDTFIFQQTFVFDQDNHCTDYSKATVIPCLLSSSANRNDYCPMPVDGDIAKRIHARTGY